MKYAWIDGQRHDYGLDELCSVLDINASGYRSWKRGGKPNRTRLTDAQMLALIQAIHAEFGGIYGSPRRVRELRARGFPASKPRVERLMQENDIRARHKRRYQVTTDSKHNLPIAANLPDRNFNPSAPNQVWTSDITYLWTDEGWLYLMKQLAIPLGWQKTPTKWLVMAIVLDLFSREVVGWSLKPRMTADIVTDALTMAWLRKKPAAGLMHHSDRGSQYASHAFRGRLREYGMVCSMSRKGNCWGNAPTESWFNSFKNERVHGVRYETRSEITAMAFEYIEVLYNRKRQHSTLGYKSPIRFLDDWLSAQQKEKLVA